MMSELIWQTTAIQIQQPPADERRSRMTPAEFEMLKSYARFYGELADWRAGEEAIRLSAKANATSKSRTNPRGTIAAPVASTQLPPGAL